MNNKAFSAPRLLKARSAGSNSVQQRQLSEEWNDPVAPGRSCVHHLFEGYAQRTPDAIAIVHEQGQVTYRELNRRANQIAHRLQQLSVCLEMRVGVCLDRSPEMLAAVLGVMKVGAAYVPLDPNYPPERLAMILEDAAAPVLLTQSHLLSRLPNCGEERVCVDVMEESSIGASEFELDIPVTPNHLAYIIYTSGSTGKPKGVCIEHRSVIELISWSKQVYSQDDIAGVLFGTSLCFDLSVFEMFVPLCRGGSVILVENALSLPKAVNVQQVTLVNTVPSVMTQLLRAGNLPSSVRTVNLAGEPLSAALVEQIYRQHTVQHVYNLYGPTEDTVYSTCALIARGERSRPPIGRPISATHVYVLDENGQPVSPGERGELYIGGMGLARGYLNRPELTSERFVPAPFLECPDTRLYRTGDLVRLLPDGNLDFLGRLDNQVKIRGFRIEPGEIETVLGRFPGVSEVVVEPIETAEGDPRLVAYYVPVEQSPGIEAEMRAYARARLPNYMAPSLLCRLDRMPLTPSGKVDRKALPVPGLPAVTSTGMATSATPTEELLGSIWCDILRIDQVSSEWDFFAIGGHSLLAAQVLNRIRLVFGIDMSLRDFLTWPTLAEQAGRIETLRHSGAAKPSETIPITTTDAVVASPMQCWLGYACFRHAGLATYNVPLLLRLTGELHLAALHGALHIIVNRHESLGAAFTLTGTALEASVREQRLVMIAMHDLSGLAPTEREELAQEEVHAEAHKPFDLGADLLLRAHLWRVTSTEHLLLLNIHHLVFDGSSQAIMLRELGLLYNAAVAGVEAELAELPIRYRDFAFWRRQQLQQEEGRRQIDYWNRQLAGTPSLLELPTDRPRLETDSGRGGRIDIVVSPELTAGLKRLARDEGVTLFMTLMAAWQTLLWRYSGQEDFVVGTPVAGRNRPEAEGVIGLFINVVMLRADFRGNPSGRILLSRVREICLNAFANQEVLPDMIDHVPRLQTMFVLQTASDCGPALCGLEVNVQTIPTSTAKFELALEIVERADKLYGSIEYSADLYDRSTVERLSRHFMRIMDGLIANSDRLLADIALLTHAETQRLLIEWNPVESEYPRDCSVHALFEDQVKRFPESVAVVFGQEQLTYRELNSHANQLAHLLRQRGGGIGMRVGLYLERSLDMVVAVLGILKAGGTYVPLDPTYPADRIRWMMKDAAVELLVTHSDLARRLSMPDAALILLDAERAQIAALPVDDLAMPVTGDDVVYIMYTSGSTGTPKGVCIPHRAVVRLVMQDSYVTFSSEDVFLLFAPISFDASTFELWGSLLHGGRLVVFPPSLPTLAELGQVLRTYEVSTLWLTSSLFQIMVAERIDDLRGVRQLVTGGDVVPASAARRFLSEVKGSRLINGYGPTESATFACCFVMSSPADVGETVSIGRAISHTRVYVLDDHGKLVPIGIEGEIYIGGDGLASGYLNSPDLTAERFVYPLEDRPQERLYRTGDRARWRSDGNLEFLGRRDRQVKIRGFRIEPSEVEAALDAHDQVKAAAVVVRNEGPDSPFLIAFVVGTEGKQPTEMELREDLSRQLPAYLVPSRFVHLPVLPMTPNGKLDRCALMCMSLPPREDARIDAEALDGVEARLAALWQETLNVSQIGPTENFFELGGHSLAAIRLFSVIEREFGTALSLGAMLKAPTIRQMARLISTDGRSAAPTPIWLQRQGDLPPLFCAPVGGGSAFYYRALGANIGDDQPAFTLEPRGMTGRPAHTTLEEMAAYNIEALRTIQPVGPYYLCGLSFGGMVAFEMARQLEAAGERIGLLLMFDAWAPGYPQYISQRSTWADIVLRVRQAFYTHRENLSVCATAAQKMDYLRRSATRLRQRIRIRFRGNRWRRELDNPASRELPEAYQSVLQAETMAREAYLPGSYNGKIHMLKARVQGEQYEPAVDLGWEAFALGGVEVIETPGTHYTLLEEPCVHGAVAHVRRLLSEAR
jgi:amino acid adenylation domain-containing protein